MRGEKNGQLHKGNRKAGTAYIGRFRTGRTSPEPVQIMYKKETAGKETADRRKGNGRRIGKEARRSSGACWREAGLRAGYFFRLRRN
jgi:hypothetical protein